MVREANKEEKESRRIEEEQEKKAMAKKWFKPEPGKGMGSERCSESRIRSDDDVWMSHQQNIKHLVQDNENSTTERVATIFKRGISTGGMAGEGEVSENDFSISEVYSD